MKFVRLFKKKNIVSTMEYYHINYLVVDNLTIIKRKEYDDNKYLELLKKGIILEIINSYYARNGALIRERR